MPPMPPLPMGEEPNNNPVKLCHDITRLSRAKAREASLDGVLSQPGARLVLSFLAYADGVTQRYLVDVTHLRPPTVSVILGKMENEGMVKCRRSEDDRRKTLVYITERGREINREGIEKIKATDALALRTLSEEEQETLMCLLGRMRQNLADALFGTKKENEEEGE